MKGDFTRSTFDPKKRYHGVFQQQGRVQMDADWNEQSQIDSYRTETGVADMVGKSGAPLAAPGFEIKTTLDKKDLRIGTGRYYVDGMLCETEGADIVPNAQEDLPASAKIMSVTAGLTPYNSAPETGVYLAYLDVWLHHLTALERPELRESALGGPDHATREKLMTHVKFLRVAAAGTPVNCLGIFPGFNALAAPSLGLLNARTKPGKSATDPCIVNPGAGFRRLENQLYRIEVHTGGSFTGADTINNPTFKWSRDNGSITARWDAQNGNDLTVSMPGRDKVSGFASGHWIELIDDDREISGEPGLLVQITSVKGNVITINPGGQVVTYAQFPKRPKIRRWDSPGAVRVKHNPDPQSNQFLSLDGEGGIEVQFSPGTYRTGDYWLIPARTSGPTTIGDIEWPRDATPQKNPIAQLPLGIRHHLARLALVEFNNGEWKILSDCRPKFASLTEQIALFLLGGDGQEAMPHPTLPTTLVPLGEPLRVGVSNGQAVTAGARVRFTITKGNGRLEGNVTQVVKNTDAAGVATCAWSLDSALLDQQVTAVLLDAASNPLHLPVVFTGSLSKASEVAFNPANTPELAGQLNVQAAIEALAKIKHAGCATYSVDPAGDWAAVFAQLKPGEDAHICFQRGEFKAATPIKLSNLGHIRITGAGTGSRLQIARSELALSLASCKSVSVEHLSLTTTEDEDLAPAENLNGVLNIIDCPLVKVREVSVACGPGVTSGRACITVRSNSPADKPLEWVRINDCDLLVGHNQYGVLVTDALRVDIEGNRIRTAALPAGFTLEKQVADPLVAKRLAAQLVARGVYRDAPSFRDGELRFEIGAFSATLYSTVPAGEWIKYMQLNPPTATEKATQQGVSSYVKRLVGTAVEQPNNLPAYSKQLSLLSRSIGDAPFRALPREVSRNLLVSREVEVKPFDEVRGTKRNTALVFSDRRVLFDSTLSAGTWQAVLSASNATGLRSNNELYKAVLKSAQQLVGDKGFRDRFTGAKAWFENLRGVAAVAASRCGIVCAGRCATEVRIERNTIQATNEGIRVAFSHRDQAATQPDFAEQIIVRDNTIGLSVPFGYSQGFYGMLVGNVRRLQVVNNQLSTDAKETTPRFETGIRVWGKFGKALFLRDNVVRGAHRAVVVRVEDLLEPVSGPARNWQLSGTWADGSIDVPEDVKRRDNVPAP